MEILLTALLIIVGIQLVFFLFANSFKTDKLTDISYGATFVLIALYYYIYSDKSLPVTLATLCVILWGLRISTYLFVRILKTKTDKRFDGIREDTIKFAKFWILQALSIFIIISPLLIIQSKSGLQMNTLAYIGFFISMLGLIIETIADYQKYIFKSTGNSSFIHTGLWKYSRHPNYAGEILVWVGLGLLSLPYLVGIEYLVMLSPIYISILLLFVSGVPTLEKKYDEKYKNDSEYAEYKTSTGVIFPKIF